MWSVLKNLSMKQYRHTSECVFRACLHCGGGEVGTERLWLCVMCIQVLCRFFRSIVCKRAKDEFSVLKTILLLLGLHR